MSALVEQVREALREYAHACGAIDFIDGEHQEATIDRVINLTVQACAEVAAGERRGRMSGMIDHAYKSDVAQRIRAAVHS